MHSAVGTRPASLGLSGGKCHSLVDRVYCQPGPLQRWGTRRRGQLPWQPDEPKEKQFNILVQDPQNRHKVESQTNSPGSPHLTLSLSYSSTSTFSQPFKEKCISEVVGTGSIIIFHLSKLWKTSILCDVIFKGSTHTACWIINPRGRISLIPD